MPSDPFGFQTFIDIDVRDLVALLFLDTPRRRVFIKLPGTITRRRLYDVKPVKPRNGAAHHLMNVDFSGTRKQLARLLDREEILEAPSLRLTRIPAEEQARLDPLLRAAIEVADRADATE